MKWNPQLPMSPADERAIDELLACCYLTDWEEEFVGSIEPLRFLSEKQREIFESLVEKHL